MSLVVTGKFDKHQKVSKSYENDCSYFRFSDNLFLLNSTLISKILLLKLDRTKGKLSRQEVSICCFNPTPSKTQRVDSVSEVMPETMFIRRLKFNQRKVSNFKPRGSDTENVDISLTFMKLIK